MPENCKSCGKPMIVMKWNSNTDVLACNSSSCRLYRQPSPIPMGGVSTLADELGGVYRKRRGRPKMEKKYAAFAFEERLQELRDGLST